MRTFLTVVALFGVPVLLFNTMVERAETVGHTSLPYAYAWDPEQPGMNYGVFRKGGYIHITTGLAPVRIAKVNGKLMRIETVMNKTLPVHFYTPASAEETALWRKHFG